MKEYEVFLSSKADDDIESIYTYIAVNLLSPEAAANQYDRIVDAILSLSVMPTRIKLMDSEPERAKGIRAMPVDNYVVFFVIRVDTVYVTRVLYGASNISQRLLEE